MKNFFKRAKKELKVWFAMRKADRELDKAIEAAWRMHDTYGIRYYVIPDYNHRLKVFAWSDLKRMRQQGMFSNRCKESDFIRECFYFTPIRKGHPRINESAERMKRKAWREYYKAYRL